MQIFLNIIGIVSEHLCYQLSDIGSLVQQQADEHFIFG